MNDTQIVSIAITVLAMLAGTLINNTRPGDVKEVLRAEIKAESVQPKLEMTELRAAMDAHFGTLGSKLDEIIPDLRRSR